MTVAAVCVATEPEARVSWSKTTLDVRLAFASAGLLLLATAWAQQVLDPAVGHCLQTAGAGLGHCALCWAAALCAALALSPYPQPAAAKR